MIRRSRRFHLAIWSAQTSKPLPLCTVKEARRIPFTSDGVFLLSYLNGEISIEGKSVFTFIYFPKTVSKAIKASAGNVYPEDVAPFMVALLTGDKSDLYEDGNLYHAMGTAGIMHVVAISGMHIAFLIGFVRQLTRSRRRTAAIGIPLILFFILMTGSSPSVIRAGFMQITFLIAPLIRREYDSITSLSAVLAALLIANPASVANTGLQLSFLAMAGVILVTPRIYGALTDLPRRERFRRRKGILKVYHVICSAASSTLGALVFTVPVLALQFGYISLVSPVTNILCIWAVSLDFTFGYFVCILGLIAPAIGAAAGWFFRLAGQICDPDRQSVGISAFCRDLYREPYIRMVARAGLFCLTAYLYSERKAQFSPGFARLSNRMRALYGSYFLRCPCQPINPPLPF